MKRTPIISLVTAILVGLSVYVGAGSKTVPTTGESRQLMDTSVLVRQPDDTELEVGVFKVTGAESESMAPFVEPSQGYPGGTFTITDPQGRMQQGDLAVFYAEGSYPSLGTAATDVTVSADGTTLTGKVPKRALQGLPHFISVRPAIAGDSRFGDLDFSVRGQHL
jgi:hypothetical protein